MNKHSKKAQIQITDLIDESVEHAVARRQKALESEGFEIDLSDNENQDYSQIRGGAKAPIRTVGILFEPSPSPSPSPSQES